MSGVVRRQRGRLAERRDRVREIVEPAVSEAEHLPHARVAGMAVCAGAGERQRLRLEAARDRDRRRPEHLIGIVGVGGRRAGAGAGGVAHSPSVASAGSVAAMIAATAVALGRRKGRDARCRRSG